MKKLYIFRSLPFHNHLNSSGGKRCLIFNLLSFHLSFRSTFFCTTDSFLDHRSQKNSAVDLSIEASRFLITDGIADVLRSGEDAALPAAGAARGSGLIRVAGQGQQRSTQRYSDRTAKARHNPGERGEWQQGTIRVVRQDWGRVIRIRFSPRGQCVEKGYSKGVQTNIFLTNYGKTTRV